MECAGLWVRSQSEPQPQAAWFALLRRLKAAGPALISNESPHM